MAQKIAKNQIFGGWKLKKILGGGGNGDVWLAVNSSNQEGAIKLLRKIERKTYMRFMTEVNIMKENGDIEGILPLLDSYLPEDPGNEIAWYAMPVAQPLEQFLDGKCFEDIVAAIEDVAKTLYELHGRGISHRDIKPENLLVRNGKVYLADFGLVDYPEKINITSSGDVVGAKWTMAPEMRREGNKADGKPADVYSLAKTLWILITKNKKGFDGQYDPTGVNGLNRLRLKEMDREDGSFYINESDRPTLFINPIEDLLRNCTYDHPTHRPTMQHFYETASWWRSTHKDLGIRNPIEWGDLQKKLFPTTMPQRAIWENLYDIAEILNMIGSTSYLNHMYYPSGGGMDLRGAKVGLEPDTIELIIDENYINLIKPKRLIFESFESDTQWNYFRIETSELEPTGIKSVFRQREELIEVEPLLYVSRWDWESEAYQGERPSGARLVNPYVKGDFVIFAKRSIYNHATSTYDARHNQLNANEFREYIGQKVDIAEALLRDKGLVKFAEEKGIPMNDVLNGYFEKNFYDDHLAKFRRKEQGMDRE